MFNIFPTAINLTKFARDFKKFAKSGHTLHVDEFLIVYCFGLKWRLKGQRGFLYRSPSHTLSDNI